MTVSRKAGKKCMENNKTEDRFQTYDEIPLFLDAKAIVRTLGVSLTTAYAMLNDQAFPTVTLGKKKLVRKEKLFDWLQARETDVSNAQESLFTQLNPRARKYSPVDWKGVKR